MMLNIPSVRMWWTEGQLKIAALKIAPPAGFSPQIHLLDTFSWGNGARDESAGWILRRNSPEILIVPQCETPGTRAGGPLTPGHLPQLSPGFAIRGRRAVVLPGAGLGSVSHADRIQAESMGFGAGLRDFVKWLMMARLLSRLPFPGGSVLL